MYHLARGIRVSDGGNHGKQVTEAAERSGALTTLIRERRSGRRRCGYRHILATCHMLSTAQSIPRRKWRKTGGRVNRTFSGRG